MTTRRIYWTCASPRVVIRDDAVPSAKKYKSRLYHIYNDPEVSEYNGARNASLRGSATGW